MCWGMNPAVGGPNLTLEREALDKLDWLVAVDLWETETAALLEAARRQPGRHPDRGLPAARRGVLREGRQHHQQRPLDPVALQGASSRPARRANDLWIIVALMRRVQELYAARAGRTRADHRA